MNQSNTTPYATALPCTWPTLWQEVQKTLTQADYAKSSLKQYRQVLRSIRDFGVTSPADITKQRLTQYLAYISDEKECSWSWIGFTIAVIRNVFERIYGMQLTDTFVTPKRHWHLPVILGVKEVDRILESAETVRDQLLLGLMYGCGLKPGETLELHWEDIDLQTQLLAINNHKANARHLPLPPALIPVLRHGKTVCPSTDYIFQGRRAGTHLSTRRAELILRSAFKKTGIPKLVSCMTLRHSYAVHRLERYDSIRQVQQDLGHRSVKTTMRYLRCILPDVDIDLIREIRKVNGQETNTPPEKVPPTSRPDPRYIPKTSSLKGLECPFISTEKQTISERAAEFFQLLRTKIKGVFLGFHKNPPQRE